ncbi:MAG: hypothetical protein WD534_18295 [Phycisphaeraceae bacterium]
MPQPQPSFMVTAEELFEQVWTQLLASDAAMAGRLEAALERESLRWLLPELLRLLIEAHDQPAERFEPMVRTLLLDLEFVDESGDPATTELRIALHDQLVVALMRAMERLRQQALASGQWSELAAPPQMYG